MTANLLIRALDEPKTFSVEAASLAHGYTNIDISRLATPYAADGSKMRIAASIKPTADLDANTIMLWVRTYDSAGKDNWSGVFAPALTANVWTRFSADITVPSGMTIHILEISVYNNPCTFDVMDFELWDGTDATKAVASHTPYATDGHLKAVYATQAQLAGYLPLSGGTLTGNVAFGKGGGTYVSGMNRENAPLQWLPVGSTDGRHYDPIMWGKSDNGDVWNLGVDAAGGIGFYAFKADRTENGIDGRLTFDHKTGITRATGFMGPLYGNASTASRLSTACTINLTGAVSGSAKFDGSGDVNITTTYTVNNSDSISLQRQIVPSAAVESSATASQAYTAGDYVVVSGVLRKVTSAIAKGNTISDSNSTATTVTGELANSVSKIVEMGKSGIWRYTKYADGTAECSGTKKYTLTKTGNYWLPAENLPFTMVKPANSCNDFDMFVIGNSNIAPVLYIDYPKDEASISDVACAVADAKETGDIVVSYFVRGRWK